MREFELIQKWAEDRNLVKGSNPGAQMLKLYEEFGELTGAIAKQNQGVIIDSIGDVVVVLGVMCAQLGVPLRKGPNMTMPTELTTIVCRIGKEIGYLGDSLEDAKKHIPFIMGGVQFLAKTLELDFEKCVKSAYKEIKDRKGKMVDGVFVKEEDALAK